MHNEPELLVGQEREQQHKQQSRAQLVPHPPLPHPTPHRQGKGEEAPTREGGVEVPQEWGGISSVKEHR